MIAVQISVLHWITQTDSTGCLKLAMLTMSKCTVVPCFLIEHAQWIFPMSDRICKWCTSQLEESNAKRSKGQFNNKSNTTIRSCFQMYFLFPLQDRKLVNWILWWIGNQSNVFLPSTHCMLGKATAPTNDPQYDKKKRKKICNSQPPLMMMLPGCWNLGTWCAFLSDILHTAACALKNKLHHYIPSHCASHTICIILEDSLCMQHVYVHSNIAFITDSIFTKVLCFLPCAYITLCTIDWEMWDHYASWDKPLNPVNVVPRWYRSCL